MQVKCRILQTSGDRLSDRVIFRRQYNRAMLPALLESIENSWRIIYAIPYCTNCTDSRGCGLGQGQESQRNSSERHRCTIQPQWWSVLDRDSVWKNIFIHQGASSSLRLLDVLRLACIGILTETCWEKDSFRA